MKVIKKERIVKERELEEKIDYVDQVVRRSSYTPTSENIGSTVGIFAPSTILLRSPLKRSSP